MHSSRALSGIRVNRASGRARPIPPSDPLAGISQTPHIVYLWTDHIALIGLFSSAIGAKGDQVFHVLDTGRVALQTCEIFWQQMQAFSTNHSELTGYEFKVRAKAIGRAFLRGPILCGIARVPGSRHFR